MERQGPSWCDVLRHNCEYLLHFACRHHVYELVLDSIFETCLGKSTGPNIELFQRFKKDWDTIDKTKFRNRLTEESIASVVLPKKEKIVAFIRSMLFVQQPRDDYEELLELCLIFWGK